MWMGDQPPGCSRFGQTDAFVPFQPNLNADGTPNPLAGKDDAALYGAVKRDPGGLPRGTLEHIELSDFFLAPGKPFEATVHVRSGEGTLDRGTVELKAPAGWTVGPAQRIGPIRERRDSTATFAVTPPANAAVNADVKLSALLRTGHRTGYTETVARVVSPVEGRFQRWGKWKEYDNWLIEHGAARAARRPLRRRHVDGPG